MPIKTVVSQAATPKPSIPRPKRNPCCTHPSTKAIGVTNDIGVKATPIVRGIINMPTMANIKMKMKAPGKPLEKMLPSFSKPVPAVPK